MLRIGSEGGSSAETEVLGMRARPAVRPASGRMRCIAVSTSSMGCPYVYSPAAAAERKPLKWNESFNGSSEVNGSREKSG